MHTKESQKHYGDQQEEELKKKEEKKMNSHMHDASSHAELPPPVPYHAMRGQAKQAR